VGEFFLKWKQTKPVFRVGVNCENSPCHDSGSLKTGLSGMAEEGGAFPGVAIVWRCKQKTSAPFRKGATQSFSSWLLLAVSSKSPSGLN